jgi:hypothetical protein
MFNSNQVFLNLGSQFATTLGANVLAFISNFGANLQPKNAQSWSQVFAALTPSVNLALRVLSSRNTLTKLNLN